MVQFYRDWGIPDVQRYARAICAARGLHPDRQVKDSGYDGAPEIPVWWQHQGTALDFLTCFQEVSRQQVEQASASNDAGRTCSELPQDANANLIDGILDSAVARQDSPFVRVALIEAALMIGQGCLKQRGWKLEHPEDDDALKTALAAVHDAIRADPSDGGLHKAAKALDDSIKRIAESRKAP